jgi:hypothetical protein
VLVENPRRIQFAKPKGHLLPSRRSDLLPLLTLQVKMHRIRHLSAQAVRKDGLSPVRPSAIATGFLHLTPVGLV